MMQYAPVLKHAMRKAGIDTDRGHQLVFTHHNKGRGKKPVPLTRVKLWFGDKVRALPQDKQELMLAELKKGYGNKFHSAHFIPSANYLPWDWQFVVWLKP